MKLSSYKIEYQVGDVKMIHSNILIHDVDDMELIEFWETRLSDLKQEFVVVYRKVGRKMLYSIFTDMRKKNSVFR